ncbi:MAG TPA: hypothetical protein VG672_02155 [Bryobacteraceae bacterium]|nr:hypothetical protein [Bryobacteraceae bacterium]
MGTCDGERHRALADGQRGAVGEKRLRVGDFRVRFTEEAGKSQETSQSQPSEGVLRIHAVRDRKEAHR